MVKKRPCPTGAFYGQEATMPVSVPARQRPRPLGAFCGQEGVSCEQARTARKVLSCKQEEGAFYGQDESCNTDERV